MHLNPKCRLTALLLALALLLCGCSASSQETEETLPAGTEEETESDGGTEETEETEEESSASVFTLGYYTDLGLNPYTCNNTTNQSLIRLLYEPLYELSPTFEAQACLAQDCTALGGDTWQLTLRSGVTFWDGTELTAADVVASLERAAQSDSLYAQRLSPMGDLEQTGEYTLTFTWSGGLGDVTPLLEIPITRENTEDEEIPTGTGPFQPELEGESAAALTSWSGWWQGESLPTDRIALYGVSDSDMLIYGFESGAITLVSTDLTGSNSLGYSGNFEVWDYDTSYLLYLGCNTASGLCRYSDFRLALQSALDRETIAGSLLSGHAQASPLTFPPGTAWYDQALADSLSQADTTALSAYEGETVTILVSAESDFRTAVAEYIAQTLSEAGLEAQVNACSWSDYRQALADGDYDLYLGLVRLEPNFDLTSFFDLDGSLNFSGYSADEITQSLAAYLAAGADGRAEAAYALSRAVSQSAPILPLCFLKHSILSNWGSLDRYTATETNLFYHFQDWDLGND